MTPLFAFSSSDKDFLPTMTVMVQDPYGYFETTIRTVFLDFGRSCTNWEFGLLLTKQFSDFLSSEILQSGKFVKFRSYL